MGLIDQLLVQGADSRLYESLVQKRGLTGSVSGGANPLLYGKQRGERYWKMMDECATARVIALEQAGTR